MNKVLKSAIFMGSLLSLITTACSSPAAQPTVASPLPTASVTRTATFLPTATSTETPVPTATSTETLMPATSSTQMLVTPFPTSEFAPFCESEFATAVPMPECRYPIVREGTTYCFKKDPYTLIYISEGMTYDVLSQDFRCMDAGEKDGMQLVACTGLMASYFELSVCDSACAIPTVRAATKKCPQGYNYNKFQGCCTKEMQILNRNCVVFEFKTTSCLIDCRAYTTEKACGKNSYACLWDVQNGFCYARQ